MKTEYEARHPVPTHREVVITKLEAEYLKIPVEEVLRTRGIDPSQPYTQEPAPDPLGPGTLYRQEIPEEAR